MKTQRQTNSYVTVERRPGGQERKEKQYPTDEDVACWLDTDIHTIDEDTMANYQVIATASADWTRNGGSSDPLKPGLTDFDDDIIDAKTEGYDEGYDYACSVVDFMARRFISEGDEHGVRVVEEVKAELRKSKSGAHRHGGAS